MKRILVPFDFSELAVNAYRTALNFAHKERAEVHLVHVIELPVLHDSVLMPTLSFEQALFKELEEKSNEEFEKILKQFPHNGLKIITRILFGQPWRMVTDYAANEDVSLMIMGTHGATGLREFFIGSNTEKVVRNATCPVLAIRKVVEPEQVRHIVFPNTLDTEHQEDLVRHVKELQHFFDARLHIVWINTPANFTADHITRKRLEEFAARFMLKDFTINIVNDPIEESGIIHFATQVKAQIIVMGTHGRKGLAHFLNGSLAEDFVNHLETPIWTYRIAE